MSEVERITEELSEAERKTFTSRKAPNDYRANEAFHLHAKGLLCFTPAGNVLTTPLGMSVRALLKIERRLLETPRNPDA